MESYLSMMKDEQTGEVALRAKLLPLEKDELAYIRQIIVEEITKIANPGCKRITFTW